MAVALCFVLIAGAAAAPQPGSAVRAQSSAGSALRIGFLQTVDSLNPYIGINDPSFVLTGLLYDYLFSLDQDGNSAPNLAVNATPSANLTQWTYAIRSGVLWSDGTPLTADDVAFTINYDSQNINMLWAFEPYMNQVVVCSPATVGHCGAVVSSPGNVTVFFQRPFAAGRALYMPIVQKAQWSAISPQAAQTSYQNPTPIGTGPFLPDPNLYNEFLNLPTVPLHVYRNPTYHPVGSHSGPALLSDLYLYIFADVTSMTLALENGDIDLAQFTASTIGPVRGQPNILVQSALLATQDFNEIGITQIDTSSADKNLNPARWDVRVRQAMAHATNKDYIVDQIYNGYGVRGTGLTSPLTPQWWFDPVTAGDNLTFNVAQANQILSQSGYTATYSDPLGTFRMAAHDITVSFQPACFQCVNPPNVTKTIPAGTHLAFTIAVRPPAQYPEEYTTAQYLQAQYAQIGIELTIKLEPTENALVLDVYTGAVEMYIWYWSADPDPNYILSMESSWTLDGWNDNYWNNASYNQAYLLQLATLDTPSRIAAVHMAQKLNYEAASYIVYLYPYGEWAMRTDTFSNWGDWAAHPYRQLVTFWGANPLFLELGTAAPANQPPSTPVISGTQPLWVQPNTMVFLTGSSTDPDAGETLTWTWTWGDGSVSVVTTTSGTTSVTTDHTWTTPGVYTVDLTVSDGQLSAQSAGFQVNVQGVALRNAYGQPGLTTDLQGAIVEPTKGKWTLDFGDGSSATGSFTAGGVSLDVGHVYAIAGTYAATLTAKMGSAALMAQAQVIIDGTPPVITVPGPMTVEATGNLTPVQYTVTATDNVGLAFNVSCNPKPGALFPLGTTTVYCYAMDLAGNRATASFEITVRDTVPPQIFVPATVVAEATSPAGAYVAFSVTAVDNVSVASGPSCTPSSGSLFPIASTTVRCSATDSSGNIGYANFTVRVQDTTPPSNYLFSVVDGNRFWINPDGRTPSGTAVFQFAASDVVGVVGYVCSLDNASFASCASPVTVSGLAPGVHTFAFAGVDAAGNFAPTVFQWTVLSPSGAVQDLIGQVNALQSSGKLTAKQAGVLLAPLNRALTDLQSGKVSMAIKELKAFRTTLNGYVAAGTLSLADASPLLNESADLILVLGGTL